MSEQSSKAWLQRLKDESWEAELLVAAISIFGTLQMFAFVEWMTEVFITLLPRSYYLFAYFVVFSALLAISILASMFIIHFMLRAYWVGLVGLNSVFSDYSVDDTENTKLYMKKVVAKLPKLDDSINRADRLCSVIFSAAFGFLMAYGWMFFSNALYLLLANALSDYVPTLLLLIPFIILLLLIITQTVLLVICNMKRFHNNEYWHSIYAKVAIVISIFSYGPLYKAIMQISSIFSSNFKHDKALVKLVLLFVLCGFALAAAKLLPTNIPYLINPEAHYNPTKAEPRYYKNQASGESFLVAPQLNNNVIEKKVVEVFIPIFSSERKAYKLNCESYAKLDDPSREERRLAESSCIQQFHKVLLNGKPVSYQLIKSAHTETKQFGATAYVKIQDNKENGLYTLVIQKSVFEEPQSWAIPFYYVTY